MSATVRDLIDDLLYGQDTVALTLEQPLRPLLGRTVYPASYAAGEGSKDKGPRYCITELRDGQNVCVVDSVPSQANRIEHAWATEPAYAGLFPQVTVEAKLSDGSSSQHSLMELGHRAADGAVLASDLAAEATEAMRALVGASPSPVALVRLSPTSLLMGLWDSRPNRTGLKLPRAFSATIEAGDVTERVRHAQYNSAWHASMLAKELQDAMKDVKKPSEIGLDGAPAGDGLGGVEVFGTIKRLAWLATVPLRCNLALGAMRPEGEHALAADYIAALGLLALTMPASPWLRSGCNLVPEGPSVLLKVSRDGNSTPVTLTHDDVVAELQALARDMKLVSRAAKITAATLASHVAASKKARKDE